MVQDALANLLGRVEATLHDFITVAVPELVTVGDELQPLAEIASSFLLDGGKRLRPAFCYWGYRAAGGADDETVVRAAASLELVQACALVHDDVIDRSDTRRGMPAVHRRFESLHASNGWQGSGDDFGVAAAVLLGDLFLVWADAMFAGSGLSAAALGRAWPVYDAMRVELMGGQFLDVVEQARGGGSVERALRVARFKAGKYTIERPLHLGAAIAGASLATTQALSAYGVPLGEAFQLRDDLLGVYGDPAVTGKPAGDDLREGKRTALVALAEQSATVEQRVVIHALFGNPDLDDQGVAALRDLFTATGADQQVEAMIRQRWEAASKALDAADLDPVGVDALRALAEAAVRRTG